MSKKLTKTIILIVFVVLLGIKDVEAEKFRCHYEDIEPVGAYESVDSLPPTIYFDVDSSNMNSAIRATIEIDNETKCETYMPLEGNYVDEKNCLVQLQIENLLTPYFSDYTYLNEYMQTQSCPSHVIYVQKNFQVITTSRVQYFFVSDTNNYLTIAEGAAEKYKVVDAIDKEEHPASYYVFKFKKKEMLEESQPAPEPEKPAEEEEEEDNSEHPGVNPNGHLQGNYSKGYCGSTDANIDNAIMKNIPAEVPRITKFIYRFLQVLVPLAIIILGSIDLVKAISAQKEDEIKKGQQMLIKRLITAVIVFFVFALVKLLVTVVSDNSNGIVDCVNCFLTNEEPYCWFR